MLLFVAVAAAFSANLRPIGAGDTLPARYLPFSLLRALDADLDEFPVLYDEDARETFPILDGIPYFLRRPAARYRSAYSTVPALLALPVYAGPIAAGTPATSPLVPHLEKLAATLITAASVVVLFAALCRLTATPWALAIALVYGLGTSSLSISSQALWPHGPGQLFLSLALYFLVRSREDARWLGPVALALGLAAVARSTNALLAAPLLAFVVVRHRRRALLPLVLFGAPLAAQASHHLLQFGAPTTGFGHTHVPLTALFTQTPVAEGVAGVLVSPGRGLFVYSPVLLLSLVGIARVWHDGPGLLRALSLGLPLVVLVAGKWFMWWGGHTFGPRLLADLAPVLCFFLYPLGPWLEARVTMRLLFATLAALSVGVHLLGAFFYDGRWDGAQEVDRRPEALWSWRDGPIAFYAREAWATLGPRTDPAGGAATLPGTSATAPALLAATYEGAALPATAVAGSAIRTWVRAHNTGSARWLASSSGRAGTVRLGWRWFQGGEEVLAGSEPLPGDVPPGASFPFDLRVRVPSEPGRYRLVVEALSDRVTWFSAQGTPPVTATISVAPAALAHVLAHRAPAEPGPPSVAITTDRAAYGPRDTVALEVRLRNPGRPRGFDAYLVLEGTDAQWLHDGQALTPWTGGPWPPWIKGLPLPARVRSRLAIPADLVPPGRYRWHIVLADSGTGGVVASAAAAFERTPF